MTYSIHGCSAVLHHPSATSTTTATTVFSGEKCSIMNSSNTVSLKRKSLSPLSSDTSQPSPKRVTLNSPPPSSTAAISATEDDGGASISPITSPSPSLSPFSKRVSEKSTSPTIITTATIATGEDDPAVISPPPSSTTMVAAIATTEYDGPAEISPMTSTPPSTTAAAAISTTEADGGAPISPSPKRVSVKPPFATTTGSAGTGEDDPAVISPPPAFSPFSKRVSEKSPFSSTTTTTADSTAATPPPPPPPPLPFSRFTKTEPPNINNKNLRRTLSEPPVFESFSALCHYMKYSQSPENTKNSSISVKSPLRRSISAPTDTDHILVPAALKSPPSKKS